MAQRVLLTGAAGRVGTLLRDRLARPGRVLRLHDIAAVPAARAREPVEVSQGDLTDPETVARAVEGVDAVVHLGGLSQERPWAKILHTNMHGGYVLLEAARRAGVPRVVLASSCHAVGFHPNRGEGAGVADARLYPRPDTFYGVSKVTLEALGSLYHDRYGLDVVCLRIGYCAERPAVPTDLEIWLSPDDCARLVEACLAAPRPGFRLVWGVSANTRRWWSLSEGRALGYEPKDDAEVFASELLGEGGEVPSPRFLGREFCSPELDVDRLEGRGGR